MFGEGRHWLDHTLACDTGLTVERSRALYLASRLAGLQGDLAAASALVEEGRELAAQLGGDAETVLVLFDRAGYRTLSRSILDDPTAADRSVASARRRMLRTLTRSVTE